MILHFHGILFECFDDKQMMFRQKYLAIPYTSAKHVSDTQFSGTVESVQSGQRTFC